MFILKSILSNEKLSTVKNIMKKKSLKKNPETYLFDS